MCSAKPQVTLTSLPEEPIDPKLLVYCAALADIEKTMPIQMALIIHNLNSIQIAECYSKQADLVNANVRRINSKNKKSD